VAGRNERTRKKFALAPAGCAGRTTCFTAARASYVVCATAPRVHPSADFVFSLLGQFMQDQTLWSCLGVASCAKKNNGFVRSRPKWSSCLGDTIVGFPFFIRSLRPAPAGSQGPDCYAVHGAGVYFFLCAFGALS